MTVLATNGPFRPDRRELAAAQRAALFILCGIDLKDALARCGPERYALLARIERLLERERLKGANRHWSYDLNRHIALKQVRDSLRSRDSQRTNDLPGAP